MMDKNEIFKIENDLKIHPIALLIPEMDADEYAALKEDISGQGLINPIIVFDEMVLDGRHRYRACRELGIDIFGRYWEGGMDPVEFVISENIKRRHLSKSQIAMVAAAVMEYLVEDAKKRQTGAGAKNLENYKNQDSLVPEILPEQEKSGLVTCQICGTRHGCKRSCPDNCHKKRPEKNRDREAREQAGKLFNVSGRSIGDAQTVQKQGTEEQKQSVVSGKASVSSVAGEIRERKKAEPQPAEKSQFNRTNDNIEWAMWTWNPVTGCKYNCPYCYARDIANRFFDHKFEPHFYPERLSAPTNTKPRPDEPNNVFVCSMADLFGPWVPDEWINKIIESVRANPQWNFLFLTKNPKRYLDFDFPENCWLGATADTQARADIACDVFLELRRKWGGVKFLSCEPLKEQIFLPEEYGEIIMIEWVIIGGQSQTSGAPAAQPEWDWVMSLITQAKECDIPYYMKPNLTVRSKQYPGV